VINAGNESGRVYELTLGGVPAGTQASALATNAVAAQWFRARPTTSRHTPAYRCRPDGARGVAA
jgi:hypothetical protein